MNAGLYLSKIDKKRFHNQFFADKCFRMVYLSETGRTGFDADKNASILLECLLSGAVSWDVALNKKREFLLEREELNDPYFYLSGMGVISNRYTNKILYHNPDSKILNDFDKATAVNRISKKNDNLKLPMICSLPLLEMKEVYRELSNYLEHCEMISIWSIARMDVELIVSEPESFISNIKELCKKKNLLFYYIENESKLPAW